MGQRHLQTGKSTRDPGPGSSRHCLGLISGLLLCMPILFIATGSHAQGKKEGDKTAPGAQRGIPVESAKAKIMNLRQEVRAVGTLNSNESVMIAAEIAGRVTGIAFDEGQRVTAGQILVRLDSSIYKAQRDRAQASLSVSLADWERAQALFKEQAISQRELEEARAQWKLDEASLRLAEVQLGKTVLKAPFGGVLGLTQVSIGEYVQPGQPIVTLDETDPIKVDFRVPEVYSTKLYPGQTVQVSIDAAPGRTFSGKVYTVDPTVDPKSRSLLVRAKAPNSDGTLRPGMFAQVQLVMDDKPDALVVPEEALLTRGQEKLVYKVVDGVVVEAVVKTGQRQRGLVEITDGLSPGDTVITAGQIKVRPGMPVTLMPAAGGN